MVVCIVSFRKYVCQHVRQSVFFLSADVPPPSTTDVFPPPSAYAPRNLNYWDSAASFAGEVENPGRTYPRALVACVALVVLCYGLPIFVGTGAASVAAAAAAASAGEGGRWSLWEDGYFAEVAEAIAGRWLGVWVVLAAAAANIGLFEAEMTSDALQLMGMVSGGWLLLLLLFLVFLSSHIKKQSGSAQYLPIPVLVQLTR